MKTIQRGFAYRRNECRAHRRYSGRVFGWVRGWELKKRRVSGQTTDRRCHQSQSYFGRVTGWVTGWELEKNEGLDRFQYKGRQRRCPANHSLTSVGYSVGELVGNTVLRGRMIQVSELSKNFGAQKKSSAGKTHGYIVGNWVGVSAEPLTRRDAA